MQQRDQQRMEAPVAARAEQRLTAQLRDVGKVTRPGCSALKAAASIGKHELLREILKTFQTSSDGIAPPDMRRDLRDATLAAVSNNHPQCLQLLLDSCTSSPSSLTQLLDSKHCSPLLMSAERGHVECMRLLLEHSPETQLLARDAAGRTVLMHAAPYKSLIPCIRLLMDHSPDTQVAATDRDGCNALIQATVSGNSACVELLLAHSPDIQVAAVSSAGMNALMAAAVNGHASCVQLLLAHSPDVQMATRLGSGRSAVCLAVVCPHAECLRLLLACSPSQQQLDRALGEAGEEMAKLQADDEQRRLDLKKCIALLLKDGAMLGAQASDVANKAIWRVISEQAAKTLVPEMVNEAMVGLALAATGHKRRPAAGPLKHTRTSS